MKKYVFDPEVGQPGRISNNTPLIQESVTCTPDSSYGPSLIIPGADIGIDGKFFLVRVLYAPTKLFFSRSSDLPSQGRTVPSQATSKSTGVSKKVVLFQSHPQIPAEFFTTAF